MSFFDNPVITKNFRKVTLTMIKGQLNKVYVLNELPYELTGDEEEVAEYLESNTVKHNFEVTLSKNSKVQVRPLKGTKIDANVTAQKSAIETWVNKLQVSKLRGFLSDELIHNFLNKLGAPVEQVLGAGEFVATDVILDNWEKYNSAEFIKGQMKMDLLELKKIMTEQNYLPTSVELADRVNRFKVAIAAKDAANQVLANREANYIAPATSENVTGTDVTAIPQEFQTLELNATHNRVLMIQASQKSDKQKADYYAQKSISSDGVHKAIADLQNAQLLGKDQQVTKQGSNLIEVNGLRLNNAGSKVITHKYLNVSK